MNVSTPPFSGPTQVAIRLTAIVQDKPSSPAGVVGVIDAIGEQVKGVFKQGDEVLACLYVHWSSSDLLPGQLIASDAQLVCAKPSRLSLEVAVKVAGTLELVAAIMAEGFPEEPHPAHTGAVPTVLITGGETLVGAVLAYALKRQSEDIHIYATCTGKNDDELHSLCGRLVGHVRAMYAIDAAAPDLLEHLQAASEGYEGSKGIEVIIDLDGLTKRRPSLKELLIGRKVLVEESSFSVEGDLTEGLLNGRMQAIGNLLRDIPPELFRLDLAF